LRGFPFESAVFHWRPCLGQGFEPGDEPEFWPIGSSGCGRYTPVGCEAPSKQEPDLDEKYDSRLESFESSFVRVREPTPRNDERKDATGLTIPAE